MKQGKHEVYLWSISFSYTVGDFLSGSVYEQTATFLYLKKEVSSLSLIKILSTVFFSPIWADDMLAISLKVFVEFHLARQTVSISIQDKWISKAKFSAVIWLCF